MAGFLEGFSTVRGKSPFPPGVLRWGHTRSKSKALGDSIDSTSTSNFQKTDHIDLKEPRIIGDAQAWKVIQKHDDECTDAVKAYWAADAWSESLPDMITWVLTSLYEALPPPFGGLLCWLIDGKLSAQNRMLLPSSVPGGAKWLGILWSGFQFSIFPWLLFIGWAIYEPPEFVPLQLVLPALLTIHRSLSIGAKYSYFALSDQYLIHNSALWLGSKQALRVLGVHKFFGFFNLDSVYLDFMQQIFNSAARNEILDETRYCYMHVSKSVAEEIWSTVAPILAKTGERGKSGSADEAMLFESRYGEISELLGLDNVYDVDQLAGIERGQIRVSLLAFYFQVKNLRLLSSRWVHVLLLIALLFSFVHPAVLAITGRAAWGSSWRATVLYVCRQLVVNFLGFPCFLFFTYPALDSIARLQLSHSMLASFQCAESLAMELTLGIVNPTMPIVTNADLQAFWVLSRVLGPTYDLGTSTRYNSAFVLIQVSLVVVAASVLRAYGIDDDAEVEWGVIVELMIIFGVGAAAIFTASLFCVRLNNHAPLYIQVARSACLNRPELGACAKDVCAHIQYDRMVLHPVSIMYMPADPKLVSFLWTGLVVLGALFASSLPNVELPFFAR